MPVKIDANELTRPRIDPRLVVLALFSSVLGGACLGAMVLTPPPSLPKGEMVLSLVLGMTVHGIVGLYAFARSRLPGATFVLLAITACVSTSAPSVVVNAKCDAGSAIACYSVARGRDAIRMDRHACLKDTDTSACARVVDLDPHAPAYCQTWLGVEDSKEAHLRCDHVMKSAREDTEARIADLRAQAEDGDDVASNSLAWILATSPFEDLRDGAMAIRLVNQALAKKPNESIYIDTLAAAYAEVGRWEDAVATQERALGLLPDWWQSRSDYELRLELYRHHKPARD